MKFETRKSACCPSSDLTPGYHPEKSSIAVGPAGEPGKRKPAAWYRVTFAVRDYGSDYEAAAALAERLRVWCEKNTSQGEGLGDRCPAEVVYSSDKSARIVRTQAGKAAGFYGPGGPSRGEL